MLIVSIIYNLLQYFKINEGFTPPSTGSSSILIPTPIIQTPPSTGSSSVPILIPIIQTSPVATNTTVDTSVKQSTYNLQVVSSGKANMSLSG